MGNLWTHVKVHPLKSFVLVYLCSNRVIRALNNHLKGEAKNEKILHIIAVLKEYGENSVQNVLLNSTFLPHKYKHSLSL